MEKIGKSVKQTMIVLGASALRSGVPRLRFAAIASAMSYCSLPTPLR
jgi:hypothetical protein